MQGSAKEHIKVGLGITAGVAAIGGAVWAYGKYSRYCQVAGPIDEEYDYIIVGGGSSGAVVAARLSEHLQDDISGEATVKVLLLEGGCDDRECSDVKVPIAAFNLQKEEATDWQYMSSPQEGTVGRIHNWPRGKLLGGCSSINIMLWVRGNHADYDRWYSHHGCAGWAWKDVLPYFMKCETWSARGNTTGFRGRTGPIHVHHIEPPTECATRWIEACQQAGIPYNSDYNGATQDGCARTQANIHNGERVNTSSAYIHPNLERDNLDVRVGCHVTRVLISPDASGKLAANGVEFTRNGTKQVAYARREVIVCAGAVGSPHLLMLSGVGPTEELNKHRITVVRDLPVGKNLHDHIMVPVGHECTKPITFDRNVIETYANIAKYALFKSGPLASQGLEAMAFLRTRPSLSYPDLQIHFIAGGAEDIEFEDKIGLPNYHKGVEYGFTSLPTLLHPKSTGEITLASSDPKDHPIINPRYLTYDEDVQVLVEGVKISRKIHASAALDDIRGSEIIDQDLVAQGLDPASDEYIEQFVRKYAITVYHPVGTCKMGSLSDPSTVVDSRCRVKGVSGLRVVDCSIMPELPSANTNLPAIMVGEKASDMIKEDWSKTRRSGPRNWPSMPKSKKVMSSL